MFARLGWGRKLNRISDSTLVQRLRLPFPRLFRLLGFE